MRVAYSLEMMGVGHGILSPAFGGPILDEVQKLDDGKASCGRRFRAEHRWYRSLT